MTRQSHFVWLAAFLACVVSSPLSALPFIGSSKEPQKSQFQVAMQGGKYRKLEDNVRNYIGSLTGLSLEQLQGRLPALEKEAEQALQALGYYHASIESQVTDGQPPQLEMRITPGEPVRLSAVDIRLLGEALELKGFLPARDKLPQPGDTLNHSKYEAVKSLLQGRAQRYGFFQGRFSEQQLLIDPENNSAQIVLYFDSGPRYRLGEVTFVGDSTLSPVLLQRMVSFAPDTPYESSLITNFSRDLRSTGYFRNVMVSADYRKAEGTVIPVQVWLHQARPRGINVGIGYSTDLGPRLTLDWQKHYVNSRGHNMGFTVKAASAQQNASVWYEIPLNPPLDSRLHLAAGFENEEIADNDSRSSLFALGPELHTKLPNDWERVLSLKWHSEDYRLGNDDGHANLFMPGIGFDKLHSDDAVNPSQGYRLHCFSSVSKEGILADMSLAHLEAGAKGLITIGNGHRFLARVDLGGNFSNANSKIPPSQRFFAGGDQNVRGYRYQRLSPKNSDGDYIGGRYMVAYSGEYQYPLAEQWRLATFMDRGNAFNSPRRANLKTGVGFGIRWISPVGPIRLDLAHGLDGERAWMLHFSMGSEL